MNASTSQDPTWADLTHSEQQVALFFERVRPMALGYLSRHFAGLTAEDREDVLQEAMLTLWQQLTSGRQPETVGLTSLSSYFCGICRICAIEEAKRRHQDPVMLADDILTDVDPDEGLRRIDYLIRLDEEADDHADSITRRKAALVRQMVRSLPAPCNELLWSLYRDGLTMRALAQLYHYASEAVARVMSHNCRQKFARRYAEEVKKIY